MSGFFQLNSITQAAATAGGLALALYKPLLVSTVWVCPFDGYLLIRGIAGGAVILMHRNF